MAAPAPLSPAEDHRGEEYREDPTVPWWDRPEEPVPQAPARSAGRLLLYAALLLLALLCTAVGGAVVFG